MSLEFIGFILQEECIYHVQDDGEEVEKRALRQFNIQSIGSGKYSEKWTKNNHLWCWRKGRTHYIKKAVKIMFL